LVKPAFCVLQIVEWLSHNVDIYSLIKIRLIKYFIMNLFNLNAFEL
jgi:hypothetical protein